MAITFPGSPIEGQTYLAENGFTYIYDSQKNRWKRGGEFVRSPKVLSYAGVAATTTGSGIFTGPTGSLVYNIPEVVVPNSTVGVDSFKAYRTPGSYPNYTEVQVSISSAFSSVAYAATFAGTTHTIPSGTLSGDTTYYLRARQFVGSDASAAGVGAISGYSQNIVSFATTSTFIDTPVIVSISGSTDFPVYQIGSASTTLPATVTYTGSGVGNLEQVDWRVTGPRIPTSTGDTALAEIGIGTHSSSTLANALVLALPFSGATGVGITDDVNNAIRTASGASSGTTKTITNAGAASTVAVGVATTTAHYYPSAAYFSGATTSYLSGPSSTDFNFGTDDFTIEFWVYSQATNTNPSFFRRFLTTGPDSVNSVQLGHVVTTTGVVVYYTNTQAIIGRTIITNRWAHIALVRKGTIVSLYIDGVLDGIATDSNNKSNQTLSIANYNNTNDGRMQGYMQDLKIYKGLAKYTENFTPPLPTYGTISYTTGITNVGVTTSAFYQSTGDVGIAETSSTAANALVLAMPMNKTFGFQDINVAIRGLTSGASAGTAKTVGLSTTNFIISSTESKWYDGAVYFDGGDYGEIAHTTDLDLGSGDFSFECWVYPTSNPGNGTVILSKGGTAFNDQNGWTLLINGSNIIQVHLRESTSLNLLSSQPIQFNTWTHILVSRNSGIARLFVNGILNTSSANTFNIANASYPFYLGRSQGNGGEYWSRYNGYLQDLKIYKGFAKYTADFTPPQPICGFSTDISTQTGFTTTTASGALLSSVVGLGSTSTLAFDAGTTYANSITSSTGISTLPDVYADNLVLALPLSNISAIGSSFTNDGSDRIRSVSGVNAGFAKTTITTGSISLSSDVIKGYSTTASFVGTATTNSVKIDNSYSSFSHTGEILTIEGWFYFTPGAITASSSDSLSIFGKGNRTGLGGDEYEYNVNLYLSKLGVVATPNGTQASGNWVMNQAYPVTSNTWYHIVLVIDGTGASRDAFLYVNGVKVSSTIGNTLLPTNALNTNLPFVIGSYGPIINSFEGYAQDIKVYKGTTPKYTTNFVPKPPNPMFGDYVSNKVIFTPGSDYVLEAKNTSSGFESVYSPTRQWGTKPEGGIYDPYAGNLVLAIPGGAVGGATTTFDVTGQIRFETPTATYVNAGIVTYSNSLGIGTYQNKSVLISNNVSISSTISKYYGRSIAIGGGSNDTLYAEGFTNFANNWDSSFTAECWFRPVQVTAGSSIYFLHELRAAVPGCWGLYWNASSGIGGPSTGYVSSTLQTNIPNIWYHVAFVRDGSGSTATNRLYINGILGAQGTGTIKTSAAYDLLMFGDRLVSDSFDPRGIFYISDIRVYDFAKYTSNFTPPNQIYLT